MGLLIKAVIFDYGGVIVTDILDDFTRHFSGEFNLKAETVKQELKSFFKYYQDGKVSEDDSLQFLAEKLGVDLSELKKGWFKIANDEDRAIEKVVDAIKILKKKKYKIALLSNAIPYAFYDEEIKNLFDAIILSSEVGIRKPEKQIYLIALDRLRVKPEEAIFVDNREVNLVPARELGMKTILFESHDKFLSELKKFVRL